MTKPKEEEFNAMWINMRFNLEQLTSQSVQILNNFQPIIDQDNSLIRFFFSQDLCECDKCPPTMFKNSILFTFIIISIFYIYKHFSSHHVE